MSYNHLSFRYKSPSRTEDRKCSLVSAIQEIAKQEMDQIGSKTWCHKCKENLFSAPNLRVHLKYKHGENPEKGDLFSDINPAFTQSGEISEIFEYVATFEVPEDVPELDGDSDEPPTETNVLHVKLRDGHPVITTDMPTTASEPPTSSAPSAPTELSYEEAIEAADFFFDDSKPVIEEPVNISASTFEEDFKMPKNKGTGKKSTKKEVPSNSDLTDHKVVNKPQEKFNKLIDASDVQKDSKLNGTCETVVELERLSPEQEIELKKYGKVRTFECDTCGKIFFQNQRLADHKEAVHGRTFMCDKCFILFVNINLLEKHLVDKHEKHELANMICTSKKANKPYGQGPYGTRGKCGQCIPCLRDNCGDCNHCKFPSLKKPCIKKICEKKKKNDGISAEK